MPENRTSASGRGNETRQLVILAGGKGTRLRSVVGDLPKPMALVGDLPILEHQIGLAKRHGFGKVLFLTSYRSEVIEDYFGNGERFGLEFRHAVDEVPLGTGGALLGQLANLEPRFMVLYGDVMLDVDLTKMWNWHIDHQAEVTLLVHPNDHPHDSDLVETAGNGQIVAFHGYPHPDGVALPNQVNAALYMFEKEPLIRWYEFGKKEDIAKHLFPKMLASGQRLMAYPSREYIKDMGTPERLAKVNRDWNSGKISALAWRHPVPTVFLDRDGTINREVNWLKSPSQMELLPHVAEAIRLVNSSARLAVVITNQPVIARGECDEIGLAQIHAQMETLLGRQGAFVDGIYYCPHHPDKGFAGERPELKMACDCRKPALGLFTRAVQDLNIDLSKSWMVGDSLSDIEAARRLGLLSALVLTGHAGTDRKYSVAPDFIFLDLLDACQFIVRDYDRLTAALQNVAAEVKPGQIVAVGGLARGGKTITATILEKTLTKVGHRVRRVSLDGFLLPVEKRGPDVLRRYDLPAISQFVQALGQRQEDRPISWRLGNYVREKRTVVHDPEETPFSVHETVILEGVVALLVENLLHVGAKTLFVESDEAIRRSRFNREYARRGYTEEDIEALYQERERDESAFVRPSRDRAHVVIG